MQELRDLLAQDLTLNQVWAQLNLKVGYTKRLDFNQLYNDLLFIELGEVESEDYLFGKLPVGDYTGKKCNKV